MLALVADWFKVSSDLAQESYSQMIEAYPPNGTVSDEALEKDLEIARQAGGYQGPGFPVARRRLSLRERSAQRVVGEKVIASLDSGQGRLIGKRRIIN
jgi:hypothetical protein